MRRVISLFVLFLTLGFARGASAQAIITTVAGGGPDNVPAVSANFRSVRVAVDAAGNFYIADPDQNRVFKVDTSGQLTVVAGVGVSGFSGDGGLATSASLSAPVGVALDGAGNLFIADEFNNRIRRVDAATGIITTVAGNGFPGFSGDGGPAGHQRQAALNLSLTPTHAVDATTSCAPATAASALVAMAARPPAPVCLQPRRRGPGQRRQPLHR